MGKSLRVRARNAQWRFSNLLWHGKESHVRKGWRKESRREEFICQSIGGDGGIRDTLNENLWG